MAIRFVGKASSLAKAHGWEEPKKLSHKEFVSKMEELRSQLRTVRGVEETEALTKQILDLVRQRTR